MVAGPVDETAIRPGDALSTAYSGILVDVDEDPCGNGTPSTLVDNKGPPPTLSRPRPTFGRAAFKVPRMSQALTRGADVVPRQGPACSASAGRLCQPRIAAQRGHSARGRSEAPSSWGSLLGISSEDRVEGQRAPETVSDTDAVRAVHPDAPRALQRKDNNVSIFENDIPRVNTRLFNANNDGDHA